jgi:ferredoxin-NADP reductase
MRGIMAIPTFTIELQQAMMLSDSVRHLCFKLLNNDGFTFIPGQFITLHFMHNGVELKRSYSIASSPEALPYLELAAAAVEGGPGTALLFSLQPGDKITASGPFGRLVLRDDPPNSRYLLIGTGTGITPYRSMLPHIAQRLRETEQTFFILQGIKTRRDVLYGDDFIAFSKAHPRVTFRAHYSRHPSTEPRDSHEFSGYVQKAFADLNLNLAHDIIYLCGNPNMIDDVFKQLQTQGFDSAHVRREKYISGK